VICVGVLGGGRPPLLLFRGEGVVAVAQAAPFSGYRDPATGRLLGRFMAVAVAARDGDALVAAADRLLGFDARALSRLAPSGGRGYAETAEGAVAIAIGGVGGGS